MVNALTSATAATRRLRQRGDAEGRRGTRRRRRPRPDADAQTKIIGGGDIAAKMVAVKLRSAVVLEAPADRSKRWALAQTRYYSVSRLSE